MSHQPASSAPTRAHPANPDRRPAPENPPVLHSSDSRSAPTPLVQPTSPCPNAIDYLDVTYYAAGKQPRTKQFVWNSRAPASVLEKYEQVFMWAGREGVEKKVLVRGGRASKVVWSVFGLGEFEKSREAGKRSLHLRVLEREGFQVAAWVLAGVVAANVVCWAGVVWRREERRDLEWDLMVVSVNMLMVVLAGFLLKVERLVGRG